MAKRAHSDEDDNGGNAQPQSKWHIGIKESNLISHERMKRVYDKTMRLLSEGTKNVFNAYEKNTIEVTASSCTNTSGEKCFSCQNPCVEFHCSFCDRNICRSCLKNCQTCKNDFCRLCSVLRYKLQHEVSICLSCC